MRPLSTGKESHHLGPTAGILCPITSYLCSWAGCHSMSHLTGRTSVESPPAPEGAGRRRRQMTCRRNPGLLSSHGVGHQGLRRTQLGRRREKGRSKLLSRAQPAPTPTPAFVLWTAVLWVPLELWKWGQRGVSDNTCLTAVVMFPYFPHSECLSVVIQVIEEHYRGVRTLRIK